MEVWDEKKIGRLGTVFCVDNWHRWAVEMAPAEGS